MQGLGNDFVVINDIEQNFIPTKKIITKIANRSFGVGCDQVLVLQSSGNNTSDVDFRYRIFNANGGEAYQCVNGVRCLAKFVENQNISLKNRLIFATKYTKTETYLEKNGKVTAKIQIPEFEPKKIPFLAKKRLPKYRLKVAKNNFEIGAISLGNPHAVILVDNVDKIAVGTLGSMISTHKSFPQQINVNFMQVIDSRHIKLRTYERGTGETLACGSGACAAVVVGQIWGFLDPRVVVELPGGTVVVKWFGEGSNIFITGSAEQVFTGEIILSE